MLVRYTDSIASTNNFDQSNAPKPNHNKISSLSRTMLPAQGESAMRPVAIIWIINPRVARTGGRV